MTSIGRKVTKTPKLCFELCGSPGLLTQLPKGTLVFPRTRNLRKVVWKRTRMCAKVSGTAQQK